MFKSNNVLIRSERGMQQMCQDMHCEVTRLRLELKHQAGLIRKLRPLIGETRQGKGLYRDYTETSFLCMR